jgi:hypothetical protein
MVNPIRLILSRFVAKRAEMRQGQRCSMCAHKFTVEELRARIVEGRVRRFCRQCLTAYCASCFSRGQPQRGTETMACRCGGDIR